MTDVISPATTTTTWSTLASEGTRLLAVQGVCVSFEVWVSDADDRHVVTVERPTDGNYGYIRQWRETERAFPIYPIGQVDNVMRETLERAIAQVAAEVDGD